MLNLDADASTSLESLRSCMSMDVQPNSNSTSLDLNEAARRGVMEGNSYHQLRKRLQRGAGSNLLR